VRERERGEYVRWGRERGRKRERERQRERERERETQKFLESLILWFHCILQGPSYLLG
jgi:hypothetical protein